MTPLTSVIMPVRNGERFIAEAVASVLRQIADDDEIIIVDDASVDATRSVLTRIHDRRMRVLSGSGRGVSAARNIGLAAAAGEFIAFLDHDDLWPEGRHRTMLLAMIGEPQIGAVFGRIRIRLDPGGIRWPWLVQQDGYHAPGSNLGNALYRNSALRQIDGFDESLNYGEDVDYFYRLQETGIRFALCEVDGLIHRRHAANVTNDKAAMGTFVFDLIRRHKVRADPLKSISHG